MSAFKRLLWVFIPMRDGRLRRHPQAFETFQEAQDAFERHTGVEWMDSFCAQSGPQAGFYPGEITEGPTRGSRIYPAVLRSPVALREAA